MVEENNTKQKDLFFDFIEDKSEKQFTEYKINEFNDINGRFQEISTNIDKILNKIYSDKQLHYWDGVLNDIFYFKPIKKYPDGSRRDLNELSHGEFKLIKLRYDLFKRIIQDDCSIILEDEPNTYLHVEWSRTFILEYINTIKAIRKYLSNNPQYKGKKIGNKILNIIMTTHSPVILSDFFNEEVVFLKKTDGYILQYENLPNCFAGNIAELLLDNFFVKRTIGEYAENRIKFIVDTLNSNDPVRLKENKNIIWFIISNIGDSLLKSLLTDQFRRVYNEKNIN